MTDTINYSTFKHSLGEKTHFVTLLKIFQYMFTMDSNCFLKNSIWELKLSIKVTGSTSILGNKEKIKPSKTFLIAQN